MGKKIAVILAGCGAKDGSEIHEAVMTLLAIDKRGVVSQCFAPDIDQHHVINHFNDAEMAETRNVLVESARICRGDVLPLSEFKAADFDAIIFPGGFGAAKNLFTLAIDGESFVVNKEVEAAILSMYEAKKPIGALCISPVMLAKILGDIKITVGKDKDTISLIEGFGVKHVEAGHGEIVVDATNKIVTTPCYMLDASIKDIAEGADNLVEAIIELAI